MQSIFMSGCIITSKDKIEVFEILSLIQNNFYKNIVYLILASEWDFPKLPLF